MKRFYILLGCALAILTGHAQDNGIFINAQIVDEKIPSEAARSLENKLQRIIVNNGFCDLGYTARFVLAAKIDVTQKDVIPSTPARISEKIDITLMVGDVVENKPYASCTIQTSGIGINENKTFISAFNAIKDDDIRIVQMLHDAKKKIIEYYTNRCDEIIIHAKTLASIQKYDEAIFQLVSIPNVCQECFEKCSDQATVIYQQKIDEKATTLLNHARDVWTAQPNEQGAIKVASIISNINPLTTNYQQVARLRDEVASKLEADSKREWEFKMKQYEENQEFKKNLVEAYRAVGIAWATHQPRNIARIIYNWW